MGKTGIKVIMNRIDAELITREYSKNDFYLRHLISRYVPEHTRKHTSDMSYSELLHYGYVIHGVAKRIMRTSSKPKKGIEQLSLDFR